MTHCQILLVALLLPPLLEGQALADEPPAINFAVNDASVEIFAGEQRLATYVFEDARIKRPFFANVMTLDGRQVTRNHPPIEAIDPTDHDTMHPGIWLAFGDIEGVDFWRNKGRVVQKDFAKRPAVDSAGQGLFVTRNEYRSPDDELICKESRAVFIALHGDGYLLHFSSRFFGDAPFSFGDQEEMGLGVRVATSMTERNGGEIVDANGRHGAKAIWGHSAPWCCYRGVVESRPACVAIFDRQSNFRDCWYHARDYGLLFANAFGRRAMKQGDVSTVVVDPAFPLDLNYTVWVGNSHAMPSVTALKGSP